MKDAVGNGYIAISYHNKHVFLQILEVGISNKHLAIGHDEEIQQVNYNSISGFCFSVGKVIKDVVRITLWSYKIAFQGLADNSRIFDCKSKVHK